MKRFLGLYRWAMQMKLRMGIYTLALLLCKMAWNAAQGVNYVLSLEIVGMWIACLIFVMVETAILPQGENPHPGSHRGVGPRGQRHFLGRLSVAGLVCGRALLGRRGAGAAVASGSGGHVVWRPCGHARRQRRPQPPAARLPAQAEQAEAGKDAT